MHNRLLITGLLSLLIGCASAPNFDTSQVDRSVTPSSAIAETQINLGKTVIWGGTILDTRNLKNSTQIEILGYPLNSSHRPLLNKKPLGRFIIKYPGYLESKNYSQGRQLSILGKVSGKQTSKVGESNYTYPVIKADKLHLWPLYDEKSKTSFHFGIGIGL